MVQLQTQLLQKIELMELQKLLKARDANITTTVYMSREELVAMCRPVIQKPRFKIPFEKQALELDKEIGMQPIVALAIRVNDKIICYPSPVEFPERVYILTVITDAKGDTAEQKERYARDLIEAASAILKFKLPEAEIKEKLPYAWKELFGFTEKDMDTESRQKPPASAGGEAGERPERDEGGEADKGAGDEGENTGKEGGGEEGGKTDKKEGGGREPEPLAPEDATMIKLVDDMLKKAKIEPSAVPPEIKEIMAQMVADPVATVARLYLDIPPTKLQDKEIREKIAECVKSPTPPPAPPAQCECKCEQRKVEPSEFIAQWLGVSEKIATKLAMWLEGLSEKELETLLKKVGYG
jgi:hypothetical protein